jgi:hypothetical protein
MDGAFLVLVWVVLAIVCSVWASSWGRSVVLYFFLSLLFSPLLAAVVLLIAGNKTAREKAERDKAEAQRREHERQLEQLRAVTGSTATPVAKQPSVAEELAKLVALHEKGALTTEELAQQKRRLLA